MHRIILQQCNVSVSHRLTLTLGFRLHNLTIDTSGMDLHAQRQREERVSAKYLHNCFFKNTFQHF